MTIASSSALFQSTLDSSYYGRLSSLYLIRDATRMTGDLTAIPTLTLRYNPDFIQKTRIDPTRLTLMFFNREQVTWDEVPDATQDALRAATECR